MTFPKKNGKNLGGGGIFSYEKTNPMLICYFWMAMNLDRSLVGAARSSLETHDTSGAWTERCSLWVEKEKVAGNSRGGNIPVI